VNVAEAVGGKTVFGQLAVAGVTGGGFVTAYGCDDGIPKDSQGNINKADLNYDGAVTPVTSNRLIVKADNDGDICFYTLGPAEIIVDISGVTDTGVTAIANQRTDTRESYPNGISAGNYLRVNVAEAVGGKTVFGQLAVAEVTDGGFVTAYGCADDIPLDSQGNINKADLNYDGAVTPVTSNRLIVKADNNGDICFYTSAAAEMIVDINGVTDTGVTAIANQRTDTRDRSYFADGISAGNYLRVNVAEAVGGKTVFGQLAVAGVTDGGFVTAYGCADGIPRDSKGNINKADLNYDGAVTPVTSNRLIVKADNNGDICFYTSAAAEMIVDINGVTDTGVTAIANQRTDTRDAPVPSNPGDSKNCSDFSTYADAEAWFDTYYPYYRDVAKLDVDGDLQPCESLPGAP